MKCLPSQETWLYSGCAKRLCMSKIRIESEGIRMILLGGNREKMVIKSRKPRYWPKRKRPRTKRKEEVSASFQKYCSLQLEKYRNINKQMYEQFCVERELNNQLYLQDMQKDHEISRLSNKLSQIRQMVEGWIALVPDQPQRIDETVGMTLQQIMSIF